MCAEDDARTKGRMACARSDDADGHAFPPAPWLYRDLRTYLVASPNISPSRACAASQALSAAVSAVNTTFFRLSSDGRWAQPGQPALLGLVKEPVLIQPGHRQGVAEHLHSHGDVRGYEERYRTRGPAKCQVEHPALADAGEKPGEDDRAARGSIR